MKLKRAAIYTRVSTLDQHPEMQEQELRDYVARRNWTLHQVYGWHGKRLVVSGCAYVPSIDITKRRHTSKIVILRPIGRRLPPIVLPARSLPHPDATAWSGQARYSYHWAGFRCEISPPWV